MNETTVEERIERGLILFLREVEGIHATKAWLCESEVERSYFTGCDTCGHGGEDDTISTDIGYETPGEKWSQIYKLDGSTLDFFPVLLPYIDRAN